MISGMRFYFFLSVIFIALSCREKDESNGAANNDQDVFKNPVLHASPDPWVLQKDGWYFFTHTTGQDLRLYKTQEISQLKNAEVKKIWSPPSAGMNTSNIWAPEIHFIDGKWYMYYAADDGKNENHRLWVLENPNADPFQGTWTDKGELELPDDKWAIDGNIFRHNGQMYIVWSGWEGDENVRQNIYIARLRDALTAEGPRYLLSEPEYTWEMAGGTPFINEAPQFLSRGEKIFIVYSASGCWTDEYALGMLSASSSSDPLDPSSWTKSSVPVFVKNPSGQVFGPGHNSFFKSPDSTEDWIIYHANENSGEGCGNERSARIQKFTWNSDGTPNFGVAAALGASLPNPSDNN